MLGDICAFSSVQIYTQSCMHSDRSVMNCHAIAAVIGNSGTIVKSVLSYQFGKKLPLPCRCVPIRLLAGFTESVSQNGCESGSFGAKFQCVLLDIAPVMIEYLCMWFGMQAFEKKRKSVRLSVGRCFLFASLASTFLVGGVAIATPASALDLFGYSFTASGIEKIEASKPSEDVPDPTPYTANLTVAGQGDVEALRKNLEEASILLGKQENPPSGSVGLLTRARADRKRLVGALFGAAHYGGVVEIKINGHNLDEIALDADLKSSGPASISINVDTGPVFSFSQPKAVTMDGAPIALDAYDIRAGDAARSSLVLEAEEAIVKDYQSRGYPFARIEKRTLEADHKINQLDVSLMLDPGQQARFGRVTVEGAEEVDATFIAQQANIPQGELYSPDQIAKATKRLRTLGVFASVIIRPGETLDADGSVPMIIEVKERKHRTIGAGITAGNLDGVGMEGFWTTRNLFGRAESLRFEGSVSKIGQNSIDKLDYHLALLFAKPGAFGPSSVFDAKIAADINNSDAFEKRAISGEMGVSHQFSEQISGRAGVKVEYSRLKESSGISNSLLVSTPLELSYDSRDNVLDPREGIHLLLKTEPTISNRNKAKFVKSSVSLSAYQALDDAKRFVIAGRVEAGTILGASRADIPKDRLFFAGGGNSIRGYAHQAAGPRGTDGKPSGGRSFTTASLEARVKMTDTIGLAAFVDTGGAFDGTKPGKNGQWFTGVGAGVRYLTPIGPLRADVAIPLKKIKGEPQYGVYLGLGQAF
ncbi:MAG TPA: outer membrane protein assembly factor [Rhizobiales bacterium]|nr:outer membrane protein assembly factor [Hyphomicrobiales bacterium]